MQFAKRTEARHKGKTACNNSSAHPLIMPCVTSRVVVCWQEVNARHCLILTLRAFNGVEIARRDRQYSCHFRNRLPIKFTTMVNETRTKSNLHMFANIKMIRNGVMPLEWSEAASQVVEHSHAQPGGGGTAAQQTSCDLLSFSAVFGRFRFRFSQCQYTPAMRRGCICLSVLNNSPIQITHELRKRED